MKTKQRHPYANLSGLSLYNRHQ